MHASLNLEVTYGVHQLKIFIVEDALRASRWQLVSEASCEIGDCPWFNWMQFDQVIFLLINQGVDASKADKSFEDGADLFVVVGKLIGSWGQH